MPKQSAGLLLYRWHHEGLELLLVHPGGPFWRKKNDGSWMIPKGEFTDAEDAFAAAKREFTEETGADPPAGEFLRLRTLKQSNAKTVHVWAVEGDFDPARLKSNLFTQEWPPRTGRTQEFPEVDRAGWFTPEVARRKILASQVPLIDELVSRLSS